MPLIKTIHARAARSPEARRQLSETPRWKTAISARPEVGQMLPLVGRVYPDGSLRHHIGVRDHNAAKHDY
jgi:hypothetical protein